MEKSKELNLNLNLNLCGVITKSGEKCKGYKKKNCDSCWVHQHKHDCSICFETIIEKYTLQCGHSYCQRCISKWIYLLNNQTCPLCRADVESEADYDSFEYCLDNLMLTNYVINQFNITDQSLIDYIKLIIHEDGHYYDLENWQLILKYIKTDPEMCIKWATNNSIIYTRYVEYNPENPGVIVDGRSYTYGYRFVFQN